MKPLSGNFQKISTNRFIVDSPRFWRPEFNPRFRQIFTFDEFESVFLTVNEHLSFPLPVEFLKIASVHLYEFFSDYRFAEIPYKNPNCVNSFLADMFFVLCDVLGRLSLKDFPLTEDDFNVVTHRAETGKNDTARVAVDENIRQDTKMTTQADILSESVLSNSTDTTVENADEKNWQNTKVVGDTFLSPQDVGVKPTTVNTEFEGVDGITLNPGESYTTSTVNQNTGDSIKNQRSTINAGNQSVGSLRQNNDARTGHETDTGLAMGQSVENTLAKNDNYVETLDYDRSNRLQNFYDLNKESLWNEILQRLSRWILRANIATGDYNYVDCPIYE